tara:strand:+ start:14074 stop:14685 length:612 start_codon:yes stop_codon:yes gene_type:complete
MERMSNKIDQREVFKSLAKFQQEVPVLLKGSEAYGYKYIQLGHMIAQINPLLKKHGLGFTQLVNGKGLTTVLFHAESGQCIQAHCDIPEATMKGMNAFQTAGAGITYFRRYALGALLGIITDKDTDANIYKSTTKQEVKKLEDNTITKATLNINDKEIWKKVLSYIAENKSQGLPSIVKTLERKYKVTADVKKEIHKQLKSAK